MTGLPIAHSVQWFTTAKRRKSNFENGCKNTVKQATVIQLHTFDHSTIIDKILLLPIISSTK